MPMLPPLSGVAISQSTVTNNQVQLGDVFATQTLNVVDTTDATTATTTATGNGVLSAVATGSLAVTSSQINSGDVNALTHLYSSVNSGAQTVITTAASGNASEADSLGGGGLTGTFSQVNAPATSGLAGCALIPAVGCVKSENDFNAISGQTAAASVNSQAIANSMSFGVTGGSSNVTTTQWNSATVDAESGSEPASGATLQYTGGTAAFTALAVTNNITATGIDGASQTINATQTATNDFTQAGQFVDVGNGQTIVGEGAATANNISLSNTAGDLNVTDSQANGSFIEANSVATAFEFGSGEADSSGVGNETVAANFGPTTEISNTQVNNNGLQSTATFTGGNTDPGEPSYDASASASAIANATTAFACSACDGVLSASSSQTNTGGVGAVATVNVTGANRSVSSVATAMGNNATFYVSKPST